ncbi:MAG: ATP-binding cassette domain-containing protein [Gammaproteobacteria bacterium]
MQNTLSIKNLSIYHLDDINIEIASSNTIGISGDSGTGKSILLHAIADMTPYTGTLLLNGVLATEMKPNEWRKKVGLLTTNSYWWATKISDHFESEDDDDFVALGLDYSLYHTDVSRCSTGELQRLALIRLLANKPEVLLLDEPTANLDESNRYRVEELIHDYQQQHKVPVIWVSHDIEQLKRMTNNCYIIDDGQLRVNEACIN